MNLREEHVEVALQERLRCELHCSKGDQHPPSHVVSYASRALTNAERVLVCRDRRIVDRVQRPQTIERDELVAVRQVRRDVGERPVRLRHGLDVRRRPLEGPLPQLVRCRHAVQEVHRRLDQVDVLPDVLRHRVRVAACVNKEARRVSLAFPRVE